MRQWLFAVLALTFLGCEGATDFSSSPLHKLCMNACAHVHAENCLEAPAVDVTACDNECSNVQALANSPCTDENAALYECISKSTIVCSSISGQPPNAKDCDLQRQHVESCQTPGLSCARSFGSDDICFQFGFKQFFTCSEGIGPGPECIQVTGTGFCCP